MIRPRQRNDGRIVLPQQSRQPLQFRVHLEQQRAMRVAAHHALQPEERTHARTAHNRCHAVQAAAGVEHHVARRKLDAMFAEGVVDHEFAAVVVFGLRQEQRAGEVAADAESGAAQMAHGVVNVVAEGLAARIAVEQRRIHLERQRSGKEQRIGGQRILNQGTDLARSRRALGQLHVAFDLARLRTGSDLAVHPLGSIDGGAALRDLLRSEDVKNAVIFCNRKRDISTLVTSLKRHDFSAVALHGDMTQSARLDALQKFKDGDVPLMIASDVAARGLDIAGLSHVFNFDVPGNAEDYVHRIGRTGRAGKSGRAFTIAASEDDRKYVGSIEKLIGKPIPLIDAENNAESASDSKAKSPAGKSRGRGRSSASATPEKDIGDAKPAGTAPANEDKADEKKANAGRSRGGRSRKKHENAPGELPAPPECSGDTLKDTGHVPAFLLR